jgi:Ca2+-binding RTX toxin-like protein
MSLFGDLDLAQFATIYRVAVASYGKAEPPAGFEALTMSELGIDSQGDKTIFTSKNGRGKAIVTEFNGELIVGFRGTDKFNDYKDYDNISFSGKYYKQFEPLIEAVAAYKTENDLNVTFTGISLGGAVANIIADRSANGKWNGAFEDAHFVGVSAPYLSASRKSDVFNFGFQNDPVYHVVPGSWTAHAKEMATRNLFIYQQHQKLGEDNLGDRIGNHEPSHVGDMLRALAGLTVADGQLLADVLKPNSYVMLDDAKGSVNMGLLRHNGDSVLTVLGQDRADKLYGASTNANGSDREWIFGRGGSDEILGRGGHDELYGGDGDDRLDGGRSADLMFGGNGDDMIILHEHRDRAEGGADNDRFIVGNIALLKNNDTPSVFIDDFAPGEDKLVLNRIDGNLTRKGEQGLHLAGFARYDDTDGLDDLELGYVNDRRPGSVTIFEDGNGRTLVIVNLDNDRQRELEIVLDGDLGDISSDLVL